MFLFKVIVAFVLFCFVFVYYSVGVGVLLRDLQNTPQPVDDPLPFNHIYNIYIYIYTKDIKVDISTSHALFIVPPYVLWYSFLILMEVTCLGVVTTHSESHDTLRNIIYQAYFG